MPRIGEVVDRIHELEKNRESTAEFLKDEDIKSIDSDVLMENCFLKETDQRVLPENFSVCGVDGGIIKKQYSGVDVVLSRAAASLFYFSGGKLDKSMTLPRNLVSPDVQYIESPLDVRSFNLSSSFIRLHKEVSIAIKALEEEPDMLLLDGSIVPQYAERPEKGSEARKFYDELIDKYETLFEKVISGNVLLGGVIEDSRSKRYCEELAKQDFIPEDMINVLENTRDTNMLEYLMEKGQRTGVMRYAKEYEKHVVLNDIGEKGKRVKNFYLKTAKDASPIRIDFLGLDDPIETAEKLSEKLVPLCSYSSTYGIPSVIVEADQRAKLSEQDLKRFESRLSSVIGPMPGLKSLRRNTRPF